MVKIYKDLDEMINSEIEEGIYIHIASTLARPNVAVNSLVRNFWKKNPEFTISSTAMVGNLHIISMGNIAKRAIVAFCGDNCLKARPNKLYNDLFLEKTPFEIEQSSTLSIIQRLMGGAMNLEYITTNSIMDSDIEKNASYAHRVNVNGKNVLLLESLKPDITVMHGVCADEDGNIVTSGPLGEGVWGCLAAKKGVIATVEKIISKEEMSKMKDRIFIPNDRVIAITEVKYGAYPQGMIMNHIISNKDYYDDYKFFEEIRLATKEEKTKEYIEKYIENIKCFDDYNKLIEERISYIEKKDLELVNKKQEEKLNKKEILTILTARAIVEKVIKNGYKTILTGIGFSHLACWLAREILYEKGIDIKIMSELGFYGVSPQMGDVYLFSQRHSYSSEKWSNIIEILGTEVSDYKHCLGVIGAAEIDEAGNINSSMVANGKYMIGSGGANDITSVADTMAVIMPSKERMIKNVRYITCNGKKIISVITPFGRLDKNIDNKFELATWKKDNSEMTAEEVLANETSWEPCVSENIEIENEITEHERKLLWQLDWEGEFR